MSDLYDDPDYKAFIQRLTTDLDESFKNELLNAPNQPLDNLVPGYPLPMRAPKRRTKEEIISEMREVTSQLTNAMTSLTDAAFGIQPKYKWDDWEIVYDEHCTIMTDIPAMSYHKKWWWIPEWYVQLRQRALIKEFGYLTQPTIILNKFKSSLYKPHIRCHPDMCYRLKAAMQRREDLGDLVNTLHRRAVAAHRPAF